MADFTTQQIEGDCTAISIKSIKQTRVRIDALIQLSKENIKSAECTLALRNLQMAKAWLGEMLSYFGEVTPYKVVNEPENIQPTADVSIKPILVFESHLDFVNYMRGAIQAETTRIPLAQKLSSNNVFTHLTEARMWYGFELQNIKKQSNAIQ